jgi:hypothetical protein
MTSPDAIPLGYNWYRKLAEWVNKPAVTSDIYQQSIPNSWMALIGFEPSPMTKNIQEKGRAAREAAEKSDEILRRR